METRRDRQALARDAGMGQLSAASILAGTLAAYGAVAVLLAIAGGTAAAVSSGTDFSNVAWTQLKAVTGIIVALKSVTDSTVRPVGARWSVDTTNQRDVTRIPPPTT